ncbi:MAG: hypothetical protein AAFP19_25245 [Bacteroidota bacterium]
MPKDDFKELPNNFHQIFEEVSQIKPLQLLRNFNRVALLKEEELTDEFEGTQEFLPFQIPDHFRYCIPIQKETELAWEYKDESKETAEDLAGEFYLEEFMTVLFKEAPKIQPYHLPEAFKEVIPQSKIIDDQKTNGNGRLCLLRIIDEAKGDYELWYYRQGELFQLHLNYPEYLSKLCETKGIYDWQLFFCKLEHLKMSKAISFPDDLLEITSEIAENLPRIFPGTDNKSYLDFCKQLKES